MKAVDVFFYGSYMNRAVLAEVDFRPPWMIPAHLRDFEIRIRPRANLITRKGGKVYGVIAPATHDELDRLYTHAHDVLGERYLPEAVLVEELEGPVRPALCYVSPDMVDRPADAAYVGRIVEPAIEFRFPAGYVETLRGFVPSR